LDALGPDLDVSGGLPADEHIDLSRSIQATITIHPEEKEIRLMVPNHGDA